VRGELRDGEAAAGELEGRVVADGEGGEVGELPLALGGHRVAEFVVGQGDEGRSRSANPRVGRSARPASLSSMRSAISLEPAAR